jgi:hypothetical protein
VASSVSSDLQPCQRRVRPAWTPSASSRHVTAVKDGLVRRLQFDQAVFAGDCVPPLMSLHSADRSEPLNAARAEPDNLPTLTAVLDTSRQRAESAVWSVCLVADRALVSGRLRRSVMGSGGLGWVFA